MENKLLSVIIANRNDTVMLSITVNSCIEELRPLGLNNCEIIIVDNSDEHVYKMLGNYIPVGYVKDRVVKFYRQDFPCLFSARELAIEKSSGKYICCLDSHMLVGQGMFVDLVKFMEESDDKVAFAHAPIRWAHHHERNSKHDRDMSSCELGNWNSRYNVERTITWKGMPWICTRKTWQRIKGYGALGWYHISWGGGDMHIGIKPWLLGMQNWAVPTNAAIHIGPFPKEPTSPYITQINNSSSYNYRLYNKSGKFPHTFGFLVSCYILGGEPMMERNLPTLTERFGKFIDFNNWWEDAKEIGKDEKTWLDVNKVMAFEELLEKRPWNE